jgi:ATP-dependent DNA ligase
MKRQCQAVSSAFDIIWLNGRDLRELLLLEHKNILRSVIPRKPSWVGYVNYMDLDSNRSGPWSRAEV